METNKCGTRVNLNMRGKTIKGYNIKEIIAFLVSKNVIPEKNRKNYAIKYPGIVGNPN